ncbi:hypothetical protein AYK20_07165 [Thermoplasmatales archaeon SG8-52-1]|nr:MAG: hypothetical protein AYK20_07165 [Thermoplasmatales archaeon SG8-52-1]
MKNNACIVGFFLVLITLILCGCQDLFIDDGKTIYQSHATKISYTLSYGYKINCSNTGRYKIHYNCDLPEVLKGQILSTEANNDEFEEKTIVTNNIIYVWDINSFLTKNYDLGVTTSVEAESYIGSDLNGENALSIQEIKDKYQTYIKQYCQAQANDTTIYIDPNNPSIKAIASNLLNAAGTNNSFLVTMKIFKWLKENTFYQVHIKNNNPQPVSVTLQNKTGDCDDLSFLYISLCRSIGIPSRFIRGFLIEENNAIPHAWVEVFVGPNIGINGWIPVECAGVSSDVETEIYQNFGLESVDHLRLFKDDGSNESLNISLSGISYITYGDRKIDASSFADVSNYVVLGSNELLIDEKGNRRYI